MKWVGNLLHLFLSHPYESEQHGKFSNLRVKYPLKGILSKLYKGKGKLAQHITLEYEERCHQDQLLWIHLGFLEGNIYREHSVLLVA